MIKQLITIITFSICISSFSQNPCNHIDCICFLPTGITEEMIELDTTYTYSTLKNTSEYHTKFNKDSSWNWESNYVVKHYSVSDTLFEIDTALSSEGFIYNSKRNDVWTTYIYSNGINSYCQSMIWVSKMFYLNETPTISVCNSSRINREFIEADFYNSEMTISYPFHFRSKHYEKDTTIYLSILCKKDSVGELICTATTEDNVEIFKVPSRYLEDELMVNARNLVKRQFYKDIKKQ